MLNKAPAAMKMIARKTLAVLARGATADSTDGFSSEEIINKKKDTNLLCSSDFFMLFFLQEVSFQT